MQAMILAAGYGKRLMPITSYLPTPMIQVYNKPLMRHTIDNILNIGTTLDVTYSLTDVAGRTIINNSSKKTSFQ